MGLWDGERRRGLEPPETAPRGFLQVSPEGVGDEDSCSSSAPLSPSSSPRSMASGSVCPPGKCVCNSCGLEIVDKYLLKVGRSREAQGQRGSPGALGEEKSLLSLSFPLKFSLEIVDFLSTMAQSGATHAVGKSGRRNLRIPAVAKLLTCDPYWSRRADTLGGCAGVSHLLVEKQKWGNAYPFWKQGPARLFLLSLGLWSLHPQ